VPNTSDSVVSDKHLFFRLWKGEDRLWCAFWLAWLAGGLVVGLATVVLADAGVISDIMAVVVRVFYIIYSCMAVWRNAFNCKMVVWAYAARTLMAVSILLFIVDIARQWFV